MDNSNSESPFAGLGFNKKFFDQLYNEGLDITLTKEFPDHHKYSQDDMFTLLDEANKNDNYSKLQYQVKNYMNQLNQ
mgnify:CR=1 FL=1